jgi:hypothetical protein
VHTKVYGFYYLIIIVNILLVSVTLCGLLQESVFSEDITNTTNPITPIGLVVFVIYPSTKHLLEDGKKMTKHVGGLQ